MKILVEMNILFEMKHALFPLNFTPFCFQTLRQEFKFSAVTLFQSLREIWVSPKF